MKEWCHINIPDPELSVCEAQKNLFNRPINMYDFEYVCSHLVEGNYYMCSIIFFIIIIKREALFVC